MFAHQPTVIITSDENWGRFLYHGDDELGRIAVNDPK